MRIAIVGPFDGPTLSGLFDFQHSSEKLPPGYGGAPLMSVLARALVDRGHEVAAITTDYTRDLESSEPYRVYRAKGLTAYFCPGRVHSFRPSSWHRGRALDMFAYERRFLTQAVRAFGPEVIHAHWTYEFTWAALDSGFPVLATSHDSPWKVLRFMPNPYRAVRYAMARRVIARCQSLTAVSTDLANDIAAFTRAPITVIPNPISKEIMAADGCSADAFASRTLVMVLNGWTSLKNGTSALRGFQRAREIDPNLRLVCFGKDWEAGGLAQQWAERKGLAAGVEFRGSVPHRTILEQMQRSAALLHPSRWEACCMAIAEAMSVGLPVIGGEKTDGVPWQLDGGKAGVLVDVMDPADIASGIASITRDESHWRRVSAAARARARELFSVDHVVDRYVSMYERTRSAQPAAQRGTVTMRAV